MAKIIYREVGEWKEWPGTIEELEAEYKTDASHQRADVSSKQVKKETGFQVDGEWVFYGRSATETNGSPIEYFVSIDDA